MWRASYRGPDNRHGCDWRSVVLPRVLGGQEAEGGGVMSFGKVDWIMIVVILLLMALVGAGYENGKHQLRVEAVQAGHAEWVINEHGQRVFRWKGAK